MTESENRQQQAKVLRAVRKIHRTTAIFLFVFFLVVSLSGILLGWKKNSNQYLLPNTHKGTTANLDEWLPIDRLHQIALQTLKDSISNNLSPELERIDIRKQKGIVKFIFEQHHWGIQLDGATGDVLSIGKRRSDFVENVHDGSIVDKILGTKGYFKLFYTSIMGLALLTFVLTGFWLWVGPKRMRSNR